MLTIASRESHKEARQPGEQVQATRGPMSAAPQNPIWTGLALGGGWAQQSNGHPSAPDESEGGTAVGTPWQAGSVVQRKCTACAGGGAPCPTCEEEEQTRRDVQMTRAGSSSQRDSHASSGAAPVLRAVRPALAYASITLPYRDRIQQSFGRHDLSHVRAGIGGPAREANDRIGAAAFASGDRIAFRDPPDVRLAAHESAHVIQQREGLSLPGGVGSADDQWERHADLVADAVVSGRSAEPLLDRAPAADTAATCAPAVQFDKPDYSKETKDDFATRVRQKAAARLAQNIVALGEWSAYVKTMEGFQLRAQLLTGVVSEHATAAMKFPRLRESFETEMGTHDEFARAYRGTELDIQATYNQKVDTLFGYLYDKSVTGYETTPSVAEKLQILVGDKRAEDLPPPVHVGPDVRYGEYTDVMKKIHDRKIGGCEACHEINFAWQRTAERWGDPLPKDNLFGGESPLFRKGPVAFGVGAGTYDQNALIAVIEFDKPATKPMLPAVAVPSASTTAPSTPATPPPTTAPATTATTQTTAAAPNPFVPSGNIPAGVEMPAPRTDLCGELPDAEESKRIPRLETWGPNSAIAASVIERIDSVLLPLGPRGYRVLPHQSFDALYAMSPNTMESVRDGIINRIEVRKKDYTKLSGDILAGKMPYEELCPIVDELLPSTNDLVTQLVLDDVHAWQRRERLLMALELILMALSILYPPAMAFTIPAGMLLGLARVSLGIDQRRQGRQWMQATGSGLVSLKQEAEAPTLASRGTTNIITGSLSLGLSAVTFARMVGEARAAAQLLEALQQGAVIRHAQFPGLVLLAKDGRLLIMTEAGEVLGFGAISNGKIFWTKLPTPYNPFAGGGASGAGTGTGTSMVPYGSSSMVPYGSTGSTSLVPYGSTFGGSTALTPYGSGGLALPSVGTPLLTGPTSPLMLTGPQAPLMLTGPPSPLLLTGPVAVDPGGRGLYWMSEIQVSRLPAADASRLRSLQTRMPTSTDELIELCALRTRAAGVAQAPVPGTPEHMLASWKSYSGPPTNGNWSFQRWAAGHPSRMWNSVSGVAKEETYRLALAEGGVPSRSAVLQSPSGQSRQVDALIEGGRRQGRDLIQFKSGYEALGTKPRKSGGASRGSASLSNEAALAVDAEFVTTGDRVTWVFEEAPAGPLVARARSSGVSVIIRVDNAAGRERMIGLMQRKGADMTQAQIDTVEIFVGTREQLVAHVVKRFGGQ